MLRRKGGLWRRGSCGFQEVDIIEREVGRVEGSLRLPAVWLR